MGDGFRLGGGLQSSFRNLEWLRNHGAASIAPGATTISTEDLRAAGIDVDALLRAHPDRQLPTWWSASNASKQAAASQPASSDLILRNVSAKLANLCDFISVLGAPDAASPSQIPHLVGRIGDAIKELGHFRGDPQPLEAMLRAIAAELPRVQGDLENGLDRWRDARSFSRLNRELKLVRAAATRLFDAAARLGIQLETVSDPVAPKIASTREQMIEVMTSGRLIGELDPQAIVQSALLRTEDGLTAAVALKSARKSIWFPSARGTEGLLHNEVTFAKLDGLLGCGTVPPTIGRTIDGAFRSLQAFDLQAITMPDLSAEDLRRVDVSSIERIRVLDFITGNWDRNATNILFTNRGEKLTAVAIDNEMAFLRASPMLSGMRSEIIAMQRSLAPSTLELIRSIDAGAVEKLLVEEGIDRPAIDAALRRIAQLKGDPTLVLFERERDFVKALSEK